MKKENKNKNSLVSPIQVKDIHSHSIGLQGISESDMNELSKMAGANGVIVIAFKDEIGKTNPFSSHFSVSCLGIEKSFLIKSINFVLGVISHNIDEIKEGKHDL